MLLRPFLVTALLVTSILAFAPAQAAGADLLTDDAGDVVLQSAGGDTAASSSGQTEPVDLTALSFEETSETLRITLTVAAFPTNDAATRILLGNPVYTVSFAWHTVNYLVEMYVYGGGIAGNTFNGYACLMRVSASGTQDYVDCYNAKVDLDAGTVSTEIAKVVILDRENRMPVKGGVLEDIRVESDRNLISMGEDAVRFYDAMPALDEPGATFAITLGETSVGNLLFASEDRVRVSNGGATTFVFQVKLTNLGDGKQDVTLGTADVPEGWVISVRTPVSIAPRESRDITVLVTVPFAHEHGGFSAFNVTAVSNNEPGSSAKLKLGVLHTPIPQPAGHHPDLFLHGTTFDFGPFSAVLPFSYGWMNTEATTEADLESIPTQYTSQGRHYWRIWLNPSLQMGLDFDLDRLGSLVGSITGSLPGASKMTAVLYLAQEDEDLVLAEAPALDLTFELNKATPYSFTLTPTPLSDYIPYAPQQSVYLELSVDTITKLPFTISVGHGEPALTTADFKLSLPLNEYHDRLTGVSDAASGISLIAEGAVEKVGRAGSTLTYKFQLEAIGKGGTFNVEVAGADATVGRLANSGTLTLAAGEKKVITLGVTIPSDASSEQIYEVLVFAHDKDDPSRMAIARTKTTVGAGAEASEDEGAVFAAAQDEARDTPGPGVVLVLAAVGAALLVGGRHRRRA